MVKNRKGSLVIMKNVLIVCAMRKEAIRIAERLNLEEIEEDLFESKNCKFIQEKQGEQSDKCSNIRLLITGIGKQLTAINLTKYLCKYEKPDLIINIGYAGSTDIRVGKWVNISRVYNYEWEIPGEEKYVMLAGGSQKLELLDNSEIEKVECYSSESFVTETDIEEHVAFDMELHSISLLCEMYEIPLIALKKISDNLSLDKYYENLKEEEIFELESCLNYFKF